MGPIGVPELIIVLVLGLATFMALRLVSRVSRFHAKQDDLQRRVEALEHRVASGDRPAEPSGDTTAVH